MVRQDQGENQSVLERKIVKRRELHKITCDDDVDRHPELMSELGESIGHSICLAAADVIPNASLDDYWCFPFAFGLHDHWQVSETTVSYSDQAGCTTHFAKHLVDTSILVRTSAPSPGDVVLYRYTSCFTHAGVVQPESIILSKWGKGYLWLHGIWEVPANYGDAAHFYNFADSSDLLEIFLERARKLEGRAIVDKPLSLGPPHRRP